MGWIPTTEIPEVNDADRVKTRAIRCLPGELAPYVLLPGDPARAAMIAGRYLSDSRLVMLNREFHTYTGTYQGLDVSVVSSGLGSPGAAMVVQDLAQLGARAVIRVGTAGAGAEPVSPGDLIIATGAVRDEGLSRHLVEISFPAVPNPDLTDALTNAAKTRNTVKLHRGVVHTSDAFQSPLIRAQLAQLMDAGVLGFEMEAAAVFIKAATVGLPAACIAAVDGYVREVQSGNTVPDFGARDRAIDEMISIALDALIAFDKDLQTEDKV